MRPRVTIKGAAEVAGINRQTWTRIEDGQPVQAAKLEAVEKFLGWTKGRAQALLDGEDPQVHTRRTDDIDSAIVGYLSNASTLDLARIQAIIAQLTMERIERR